MEGYPNLNNIAGGQYDWKLKQFAAAAQRDGRRISVRFLHAYTSVASCPAQPSTQYQQPELTPSHLLVSLCARFCCVASSVTDTAPRTATEFNGDCTCAELYYLVDTVTVHTTAHLGSAVCTANAAQTHSPLAYTLFDIAATLHNAAAATAVQVCISAYNFAGTSPYHTEYKSLATVLSPPYNQITSFTNKP
eukprot:13972-Heterococcus_DN1.PRE.2